MRFEPTPKNFAENKTLLSSNEFGWFGEDNLWKFPVKIGQTVWTTFRECAIFQLGKVIEPNCFIA